MRTSDRLDPGRVYTREELRGLFDITDATLNNGIYRPKGHDSVWLFVTTEKTADRTQYQDRLDADDLYMDGQTKGRTDHLLVDHRQTGLELLLFHRRDKFEHPGAGFRYEGVFEYVGHEGAEPTHFHLRRVGASSIARGVGEVALRLVDNANELRASVEAFAREAPQADLARSLMRATTYWVHDPATGAFGPGKFVGFAEMTFATYERAKLGEVEGDKFSGGTTRSRIENVLGTAFQADAGLTAVLESWSINLLGAPAFEGIDRSKWFFLSLPAATGRTASATGQPGRYWAVFANPEVYRIDDAVRELPEDSWVTGGRPMARGDRLVVWRGAGRDGRRGVVAFADVLTDPAEATDHENPYWIRPPDPDQIEPRVRVRYQVYPGLPLWLDQHEALLGGLSVARARGGTVFNLDEEQWKALRSATATPDDVVAVTPVPTARQRVGPIGEPYRRANAEATTGQSDPFERDPDAVDRGNRAHADTQNKLADKLREAGIEPRSPKAGEPDFDLAWEHEGVTYVVEVKSITAANEEKQLRLGLGQVLRYRQILQRERLNVVAVLVVEREPRDESWVLLGRELDIVLLWPPFDQLPIP